jgi:hypothetical protein
MQEQIKKLIKMDEERKQEIAMISDAIEKIREGQCTEQINYRRRD